MATIKDVAKASGVSVATVSRVLNGNAEVSPEKQKKVRSAVKELGYVLPHGVTTAKNVHRNSILVIFPNSVKSFYDDVVRGMKDSAAEAGFALYFGVCCNDRQTERDYINEVVNGHYSACILMGTSLRGDELNELSKKINIALCCEQIDGARILTSVIDVYSAAYEAVEYLIKRGHQRIGVISTTTRAWSSIQKESAYIRAMKDNGLEYSEEYMFFGHFNHKSGIFAFGYFEGLDDPPTAIFAVSDSLAIGAIKAATNKGMTVARDIIVMGFDDSLMCEMYSPTISTVYQPKYELGKTAVTKLIANISGEGERCDETIYLPHRLILRESTGETQ